MPIWPFVTPVLRYALANVDFRALYDRLAELPVRRAPRCRAHVAEALNALLPPGRAAWTPQSLFLFIAAFVKVERIGNGCYRSAWIREPEAVAAYVLRGLPGERSEELRPLLVDECRDVLETLVAIAPHARDAGSACDSGEAAAPQAENVPVAGAARRLAIALRATTSMGTKAYFGAARSVVVQRDRFRDRRIVALLARALLAGGLSTNECRTLLLVHGMLAQDVDGVLRAT